MPKLKVTPTVLGEMQRRRAEGESYRMIARRMGLNLTTVYLWLNPDFKAMRAKYHKRLREGA